MLERIERERVAMMMIAGGMLLALALSHATSPPEPPADTMTRQSTSTSVTRVKLLPDRVVAECRKRIATAVHDGLIRERPSPDRIVVDETLWGVLADPLRGKLLRAVACGHWQTVAPPSGEQVTAYGWTSGKRLATLRGMRAPAKAR